MGLRMKGGRRKTTLLPQTFLPSFHLSLMPQCAFCLNFNGTKCTNPKGVMYGKKIDDPYEEINCPEYFEDAFALAMSPEFDDDFFNIL